jgi:hypothetical protein
MNKSETIKELVDAIIKVMADVKGIEKNLTVGTGASSYKGVADKDVKNIVGESMEKNGLVIIPTGIDETTHIESWDETGQYGTKKKQSVFTKVTTTYLLCHTSGEWCELKGYGHGVDSQDKSAGKATTYALKYALLYTFLVPTGKIDDADSVHSDTVELKPTITPVKKEILTPTHKNWIKVVDYLKGEGTMTKVLERYTIDKKTEELLINATLE